MSGSPDHDWQDVALLPTVDGGSGWMHGVRFRCANCKVERRMVGEKHAAPFVNGQRVERMPPCK